MKKIPVKQDDQDLRLDVFLKETLEISRTQAKKLIDSGLVKINDQTSKPHATVSEGDEISIDEQLADNEITKTQEPEKQPAPGLEIVYEDNDVVVINKPTGVLTHPAPGSSAPSITDALVKKYPDIVEVGDDPIRPGIDVQIGQPRTVAD